MEAQPGSVERRSRPNMRKLVESTFVTLDGVIPSPAESGSPYWNDEHASCARDLLFDADALLLGRVTCDGFAASWPTRSGVEYTDRIKRASQVRCLDIVARDDVERDAPRRGRRRRGREAEAATGWGSSRRPHLGLTPNICSLH
jgi:hypothetical protein